MIGLVLVLSQNLFAKAYGGPGDEAPTFLLQAQDGGYFLGASAGKFLLLKISSDGSLEWAKGFGGVSVGADAIPTPDGGFLVAGGTKSFGAGGSDAVVLKFSAEGSLEWVRTYGTEGDEAAHHIAPTSDGGYAVFGETSGDFLVFKLSADGSVEWAKSFSREPWSKLGAITHTSDGGLLVVGSVEFLKQENYPLLVIKFSPNGSVEWVKSLGGNEDYVHFAAPTSDGGVILIGETKSFGAGYYDAFVLKLSSDGSVEWAKTFGKEWGEWVSGAVQTSDGGYALAGTMWVTDVEDVAAFLLKLSSDGSLEWTKLFHPDTVEGATSIVQTSDGGYAVAGWVDTSASGEKDVFLLTLSADGSYPDCIEDFPLEVTSPEVGSSPLDTLTLSDVSLVTSTHTLTASDASLEIYDLCEPYPGVYQGPAGRSRVLALPAPGGLLFKSQKSVKVNIYSASGRLVCELKLSQGKVFVPLKAGVYIWEAGEVRGKAAVR